MRSSPCASATWYFIVFPLYLSSLQLPAFRNSDPGHIHTYSEHLFPPSPLRLCVPSFLSGEGVSIIFFPSVSSRPIVHIRTRHNTFCCSQSFLTSKILQLLLYVVPGTYFVLLLVCSTGIYYCLLLLRGVAGGPTHEDADFTHLLRDLTKLFILHAGGTWHTHA